MGIVLEEHHDETAVVAEAAHRVGAAVDNTTREHVHIRAAEHHVTMVRSAVAQNEDYGNFDGLPCGVVLTEDKQQILAHNAFGTLLWSSMEDPEMPLRSCFELLPPT